MHTSKHLLIVIMDGEHARLVRQGIDFALHTVWSRDSEFAHQKSAALGRDAPGASFHSGSSAHHGVAPRHDPHDLSRQRFAMQIGEEVNAMAARDEYTELVLVAPSDTLNVLRQALDRAAVAKLVGSVARDLVKVPDHELQPHLREWIRPVHRPAL
jgi:protein required for attachment to host cells